MVIPKYMFWKHNLNIYENLRVCNIFFIFGNIIKFFESRYAIGILVFWWDFCPIDIIFFYLLLYGVIVIFT